MCDQRFFCLHNTQHGVLCRSCSAAHLSCCCSQEQQRRLDAFTPAYQRLVTVVVHNVQYPSNYHEWHRDDLQEFRHNRYAISETLEDAAGKPPLLPLLAVLRHL
jgi:hypothetical protein